MKKLLLITIAFFIPVLGFTEVIQLNNGDTLDVIIKNQNNDSLIVEHSALGEITIKKAKIANLQSIDLQVVAKADEEPAEIKEAVVDEGLFATGFLVDWKRAVDVGLNGASGSSNNANFRAGLSFNFEDDEDRWDFSSVYIFKQDENETTDNVFKTDLVKDWFVKDSARFYFAHTGFDWDQFKDWDYRIRLGGGQGYHFIRSKKYEMDSRVGLNTVYEIREPDNKFNLEALLGFHAKWNLSDDHSVTFDNFLYPTLTNIGEYRNVTIFEWTHKLNYYKGLAIKLGFNNEYDSKETEKNDLKYYANIAWGL